MVISKIKGIPDKTQLRYITINSGITKIIESWQVMQFDNPATQSIFTKS